MSEWKDEYKEKMRDFLARKGKPVLFEERTGWDDEPKVSTYGWTDHNADVHCQPVVTTKTYTYGEGCHWVVPEGAVLTEHTYSQFTDTFSPNNDEVGVNVTPAHCACGKFTDMTLRYAGSLGEVIREIVGVEHRNEIIL